MNKKNISIVSVIALSLALAPFIAYAQNPVPIITSISPSSALVGGPSFTLTVNGNDFNASSVVNFNGSGRSTTLISSTQLTASIPASDISSTGSFNITVVNPGPGGGTSNAMVFVVFNAVPSTTSISPQSAVVGSSSFTLAVNGSNFTPSSVVNFNGSARSTTFVSSSQLLSSIPASDVSSTGSFNVNVVNPGPGGGTSNAQVFTVLNAGNNPIPSITSISPSSAAMGGSSFTLTVSGTNFIPSSVVRFNGLPRLTTYVSSTQLTASITASDIATAGPEAVTVVNPAPGGGTSNAMLFEITSTTTPSLPNTGFGPGDEDAGLNVNALISALAAASLLFAGFVVVKKAL